MAGLIDQKSIASYLRDRTTLLFSSSSLNWNSFLLERHLVPPTSGLLPEGHIEGPLVILFQGRQAARGSYKDDDGAMIPYTKRPGTMTFLPPGKIPSLCRANASDLLLWSIDKRLFVEIQKQAIQRIQSTASSSDVAYPLTREHFSDAPIAQLLLLLQHEVQSGGLSGAQYAELLSRSVASRLLARRFPNKSSQAVVSDKVPIPAGSILRVIERVHEQPELAPNVAELAAEAGYSYQGFFNAFRRATGYSPYQYVMCIRLERARHLMEDSSLPLMDIAIQCGFNSHAHFSYVFRRRYGISPRIYRHNLEVGLAAKKTDVLSSD